MIYLVWALVFGSNEASFKLAHIHSAYKTDSTGAHDTIWLTFCDPQPALMSYRIHFVPAQSCFPPPIPAETSPLQPQVLLDTLSAHCTSPGNAWGQPLPDLPLLSVLTQPKKRKNKRVRKRKCPIKSLYNVGEIISHLQVFVVLFLFYFRQHIFFRQIHFTCVHLYRACN